MTLQRQRLSQRRKAVGLTQESLAQHLGLERSTIARWESGVTEPILSMRPNVARALQVSMDHLSELLTDVADADTASTLSVAIEATLPVLPPKDRSEMWMGRAEFDNLFRPQPAETAEAFRFDHHGDTPTAGTGAPSPHPGRSQRFVRFAAAGVLLALVGGAACVPLMTSHSGSVAPPVVGNPALASLVPPVAASPAPDLGSTPRGEDAPAAPAALPNKPADAPAPSRAAAVGARRTIRSTSRSPATTMRTPPASRNPAIPAEASDWWSRMAALSGNDQYRPPFRPDAAPRP